MKKILFTLFLFISFCAFTQAQEKLVVGYFANNSWNNLANNDISKLTHLNIAFANPDAAGNMVTYNHEALKTPIAEIKKQGVKVLLSVAGGGATAEIQDIWAKYMQPANVDNFIDKTIALLLEYGYDGIDLDIEHDGFFAKLGANYAPYVSKLSQKLKENGLLLTTALPGTYSFAAMTSDVLSKFDFINIMTYDATGNWNLNRPGQHSSIKLAVDGINYWANSKGIPKEKIILGLPFYGWDFDEVPLNSYRDFTFAQMVKLNESYAYLDNVGQKYYNSIPTILTKTLLSENECGGVMIWHIGCDIRGKYSLLNTIKRGQSEYRNNLARNKETTSTELEVADHNPASFATDGNPTTRWSGKPINPGYLTVDLGKETAISSIHIDWEDSYAKSFEIQVSNDNENWETIKSFSDQTLQVVSNHAIQVVKELDANARYLRLKCTVGTQVGTAIWCYSIWDLRIFGQEISLPEEATVKYSPTLYNPQAVSDRNLDVTLTSSDPTVADIVGNQVQMQKAGYVEITATQNGNEEFGAAVTRYHHLTIEKADQTISFEPIAQSALAVNKTVELKAVSTSELPVRFTSSDTNVAEVVDGVLHIKSVGTCTIKALQDGDERYNSATATQTIDITTSVKLTNEQKLSVFPNPASSYITINGETNIPVEIYSITGNLLIKTTDKNIQIKHLPNGIYLLKSGEFNQRLIKM